MKEGEAIRGNGQSGSYGRSSLILSSAVLVLACACNGRHSEAQPVAPAPDARPPLAAVQSVDGDGVDLLIEQLHGAPLPLEQRNGQDGFMRNAATAVRYALWAPLRAGGKPLSPGGDGPRVLEEQELPITVNNFGGVQNTIQFSVGSHSSFDVERIDDHYVALHYEVTDEEPSVSSAQSEKKDDDAANLAALGLRIQGTVLVNACETPTSFSLVRFFDDEDGRAGDIRVSARRASPKCADPRPTTVKRNHVVHVALVDDADRRTVREYAITTDGASRISLRDGLNYPIPTVSAAGATMTFLPVGSSIDLAFKEGHAEPYLQVVFAQPQFTRYVNRSRPYVERLAVSTYVDLGQRRIVFAGERRRHPIHIEAWSE